MTIIDVSGIGTGSVFLIKGEKNILFEAGMAYAADSVVEAIRKEIGDRDVDVVLLSHSHYDHVAGLPTLRKAWPNLKAYASVRAQEILKRPGALKTIRRLSGEAAEAAGLPWYSDYDDEDLRIDEVMADGETVQIGDHSVFAFETMGHTKCSLSYIVDGDLMLCSESVGVLGTWGGYMPTFLVDYLGAVVSVKKSRSYNIREVVLNHYGVIRKDIDHIWDVLEHYLEDSKETMISLMNQYEMDEDVLKELDRIYHAPVDRKEQPDEAFYINAASMIKTLRKQFPDRVPKRREFTLIAMVDRNRGIGNQGRLLATIPADQKRFRQMTMGGIVIMGRKTYEGLPGPRPLEGRINLILSSNPDYRVKGAVVCHTAQEVLQKADYYKKENGLKDSDVFVIGGESVYRQFLPHCRRAEITWIDYSYEADRHLMDLEKAGFELEEASDEQTCFDLCYEYRKYIRKSV